MPVADLKRILVSMHDAAAEAGVRIVTGDTKVVERGHGDGVLHQHRRRGRAARRARPLRLALPGPATWCCSPARSATTASRSSPRARASRSRPTSSPTPHRSTALVAAVLAAAPERALLPRPHPRRARQHAQRARERLRRLDHRRGARRARARPGARRVRDARLRRLPGGERGQDGRRRARRPGRGGARRDAGRAVRRRRRRHRRRSPKRRPARCTCAPPSAPRRIMDMLVGEQLPRIC